MSLLFDQSRVADVRSKPGPDRVLLLTMLALMAFGVLMVFSATRATGGGTAALIKQTIFVAMGVGSYWLASSIDYRSYRHLAHIIYGVLVGVLGLMAVVGFYDLDTPLTPLINRSRRWIVLGPIQIQPSEFAKLSVILVLATVLAAARTEGLSLRRLLQTLGVVGVPAALIMLQPDLGTALVFAFLTAVMLFAAGANWRQMLALAVVTVALATSIWQMGVLKDYQEDRILAFLDPEAYALDAGYNQIQSERTIGSGQLVGKGLFQGALTELNFVPEQESDFIFTAVGEQFGFVGSVAVLGAYTLMTWRLLVIGIRARDRYGSLVAVGVGAMLVFHVYVNIGMTVRMMPVTGLPLPFMSAGGSSLLAMSLALGVANSVWLRRSLVPGHDDGV